MKLCYYAFIANDCYRRILNGVAEISGVVPIAKNDREIEKLLDSQKGLFLRGVTVVGAPYWYKKKSKEYNR